MIQATSEIQPELQCPVEVTDLTKIYQTGRQQVDALHGVSLRVKNGEFVTIMGASGSGKSTLLHLMAGLTRPTGGTVRVNNVNIDTLSDAALTRFRCLNIGVVFQAFNLIPTLSAEENILLPSLTTHGRNVSREELDALLESLELSDRRHHRPDALSGGEQQRVAIGRALVMEPALILADEPTGNLDSVNTERLCRLLRERCDNEGRTIVLVTHEADVAAWGDRIVTLRDGRIVDETINQRSGGGA